MSTGGPEFLVGLAIWGPIGVFAWLMWRRPSDRSVAGFAKNYVVPLTPNNVEQLRAHIQWTRRWRLVGVLAVVATTTSIAIVRQGPDKLDLGYSPVVAGFLVAAAVTLVASLVPATYLLLTNPMRSWVDGPVVDPTGSRLQDWFVVALAATGIGIGTACWLGCRALAQAPVPADSPDRQAVRLAIRSAAIMSVIGGATMAISGIGTKLGGSAISLAWGDASRVWWTLSIATMIMAFGVVWGAMLTLTSVPRLAPMSGRLPSVPRPEPRLETRPKT